jgi:hypothetical protein
VVAALQVLHGEGAAESAPPGCAWRVGAMRNMRLRGHVLTAGSPDLCQAAPGLEGAAQAWLANCNLKAGEGERTDLMDITSESAFCQIFNLGLTSS